MTTQREDNGERLARIRRNHTAPPLTEAQVQRQLYRLFMRLKRHPANAKIFAQHGILLARKLGVEFK